MVTNYVIRKAAAWLRSGRREPAQGNVGGLFIGVMIAAILGIGVAIPIILDVINESNVTGTTETVLNLVPLFIALLLLVAIAGPLMRRVH